MIKWYERTDKPGILWEAGPDNPRGPHFAAVLAAQADRVEVWTIEPEAVVTDHQKCLEYRLFAGGKQIAHQYVHCFLHIRRSK